MSEITSVRANNNESMTLEEYTLLKYELHQKKIFLTVSIKVIDLQIFEIIIRNINLSYFAENT